MRLHFVALGVLTFVTTTQAEPAVTQAESTVSHFVVPLGTSKELPMGGATHYVYGDDHGGAVATFSANAGALQLIARTPGQAAIVARGADGVSRLIVVDVVGDTKSAAHTDATSSKPAENTKRQSNPAKRSERAKELLRQGNYSAARRVLTPLDDTSTFEEIAMLKAVCKQLDDAPCVAETKSRLAR